MKKIGKLFLHMAEFFSRVVHSVSCFFKKVFKSVGAFIKKCLNHLRGLLSKLKSSLGKKLVKIGSKMSGDMTESQKLSENLVDIACEFYKFGTVCTRMVDRLQERDSKRFAGKYDWFFHRLVEICEESGIRIVDFSGKDYDPGIPVTVTNMDEFGPEDELYIKSMTEPTIMKNGEVIKYGTVVLALKEGDVE